MGEDSENGRTDELSSGFRMQRRRDALRVRPAARHMRMTKCST